MENPIYIKIPVLILWEKRRIDASVMETSLLLKLLMSSLCADADSLSRAVELTRTSLTRPKSALGMIFFFFNYYYLPRRRVVTKFANISYEKNRNGTSHYLLNKIKT